MVFQGQLKGSSVALKIPSKNILNKDELSNLNNEGLQSLVTRLLIECKNASESEIEDFKREIGFLFGLRHPSICMCYGGCTSPLNVCIVEYVPLGDLRHFYSKRNLDIKQHINIAYSIAAGMSWLHGKEPTVLHCGKIYIYNFFYSLV